MSLNKWYNTYFKLSSCFFITKEALGIIIRGRKWPCILLHENIVYQTESIENFSMLSNGRQDVVALSQQPFISYARFYIYAAHLQIHNRISIVKRVKPAQIFGLIQINSDRSGENTSDNGTDSMPSYWIPVPQQLPEKIISNFLIETQIKSGYFAI